MRRYPDLTCSVSGLVTLLLCTQAVAAPPSHGLWPTADSDGWDCSQCPEQSRRDISITAGVGYVSEESPRFGDYTGLDSEGAFAIGAADVRYRDGQKRFFEAAIDNAGLDSRHLAARGGEQGEYEVELDYRRTPHFIAEGARTVYTGVSSQTLALPPSWEPAGSTRSMDLESNLYDLPLGVDRDTFSIAATGHHQSAWQYGLDYHRIEQSGHRLQGASFQTNASILPIPVDRTTDQVQARIGYVQESWQMQVAFLNSSFKNNDSAINWQNPFTPLAEGGDWGRMALEPANSASQLIVSGSWQPLNMLQGSGRVSVGRMEQNEWFLAPTVNPVIGFVDLPGTDLDGQVDTLNGHLRLVVRPLAPLSLTGEVWVDERDNRTTRAEYIQVRTDLAVAQARWNNPYSFKRQGGKARADLKTGARTSIAAGASREEFDRTWQETEKTSTTDYWAELRADPIDRLNARLRVGQERRRFMEDYAPLPDLTSQENPLLRKFHLGERDRDFARASLSYQPLARVSVALSLDYAADDYRNTLIGLTDAYDLSQTLDLSSTPVDDLTVYAFFSRQRIDSRQSGSESFALPDWTGRQKDTVITSGFGLEQRELKESIDLGLDFSSSRGTGVMEVQTRTGAPGFPELKTDVNTLQLYGRYRVNETLSLRLDYWYEKFSMDDFFIDNVAPDTLANVLSVGQEANDYSVHVAGLSVIYRF